jgi:hypothetical protein
MVFEGKMKIFLKKSKQEVYVVLKKYLHLQR